MLWGRTTHFQRSMRHWNIWKLDASSGFWQIPLTKDCRLLTTFITHFDCYLFNKLPFGISSVSDVFQRRMNEILQGLEGVLCQIDDILIFGSNQHVTWHKTHSSTRLYRKSGCYSEPSKMCLLKMTDTFSGPYHGWQESSPISQQDISYPCDAQTWKCVWTVTITGYDQPIQKILTSHFRTVSTFAA